MRLRAALIQMRHGDDVEGNLREARRRVEQARASGARLVLLPEYFFAAGPPGSAARAAPSVRAFFEDVSRGAGLAVAGNLVEAGPGGVLNLGVVYDAGALVLEQPKVHPMPREAESGIGAGPGLRAADVAGVPTGMLVCADILYPEAARILALQGAQVLLNPVMSPYREEDATREARDALFVARAYDSGAFVLKAGGHRATGEHRVAGRSLVAAPWGVLAKAKEDFADETLVVDLDLDELARFRKGQAAFPARRPEAYRALLDL